MSDKDLEKLHENYHLGMKYYLSGNIQESLDRFKSFICDIRVAYDNNTIEMYKKSICNEIIGYYTTDYNKTIIPLPNDISDKHKAISFLCAYLMNFTQNYEKEKTEVNEYLKLAIGLDSSLEENIKQLSDYMLQIYNL